MEVRLGFILFLGFLINSAWGCGYESCPETNDGKLNVHLIPHSHDDVGWLKTVDQYYYGDKQNIQLAGVQYTIDSVVDELQKDKSRRFIYVESGFFWRWWRNQDDKMQNIVKGLVQSGQLEFINGGWCMNDEATTHYNAIIDQMSLGLRFLNDTFGSCARPRVAWQIDPFGHSREQASLFAQMSFDGLFFGRLDYQDKYYRKAAKDMEFVWSGSPNSLGKAAELFTGVLYNGYNPPDGFCFDILCSDEPINDDKRLFDYNLDKKVKDFVDAAREWASVYKTNHVQMTMGSDFHYIQANMWYKNLDKLIKHVNAADLGVNLIYSTPSCYLKEVYEAKPRLRIKTDDFFPYASDPHAFWTGYFTSRPALKFYTQWANNFLQACKHFSLANNAKDFDKLFVLSEATAVLQHHDAVAGTAKQHVTNDYAKRLSIGMASCEDVIAGSVGKPLNFCSLNISACAFTEKNSDFTLDVYNPLARSVNNAYVRIPVKEKHRYKVFNKNAQELPSELWPIQETVFEIPGRASDAKYELVFNAGTLSGLSLTSFLIKGGGGRKHKHIKKSVKTKNEDFWISNSVGLSLLFDGSSGLIKSIKRGDSETDFSQNFFYYNGMRGNNSKFEFRASGAYIFRPNGSIPIQIAETVKYVVYEDSLVKEVHQIFNDWTSQVVRLYDKSDLVEFEWLVGPIDTLDGMGKEIITRYSTGIKSNGIFYTDANGREILRRERDKRPTWPYKVNEPVAGNYYPVNSRFILKDDNDLGFVLLNDRSQGGTSMNDGEIEIMLHRRLLDDDAFGVGEALDETAYGNDTGLVVRGKHWILFGGGETGVPLTNHRKIAQELFMGRIFMFSDLDFDLILSGNSIDVESNDFWFSNVTKVLPQNVHLLTLEPLSANQFLLRIEHFYEAGEETESIASVNREELMKALSAVELIETNLGANLWKSQEKHFEWNVHGRKLPDCPRDGDCSTLEDVDGQISLKPMEIRTFIGTKR